MKRWLFTSLFLALALVVLGCAVRRSHDCIFGVNDVVTAEDGSPLKDTEITLEVDAPVYEAVTPVKVVRRFTDDTGGLAFTYIDHERGVKYTLAASKDGFETRAVSGNAPPAGHHTIVLKRKDRG